MDENTRQLSELLHQAAETHHQVFAMTDGEDPDWATWYSDWLVNLSKCRSLWERNLCEARLPTCWSDWIKSTLRQRPP